MDIEVDANTVGVALLVSNDYATLRKEDKLRFTHTDTDNMAQLFKEFTYAVYRKKNVSTDEFVSYYIALADFKYPPSCKRTLIYFSGHGKDGVLVMQDGKEVKIEDMISRFKIHISNNATLVGVVKMFFVDACRGSQKDHGYYPKAKPDDEITCLKRVPKEGSTLVAYASTRYHISIEDVGGGRWTNCLIKALRESKENDDVHTILTRANIMLRDNPNQRQGFQTAEFTTSLADFVCFKQEAMKMRNILVIGHIGSGKTTLINNVIGEGCLHTTKGFAPAHETPQHVQGELCINNNKYQCTFIELPGAFYTQFYYCTDLIYISLYKHKIFEQITDKTQRECLERLNLIICVTRCGRIPIGEKFFQGYPKIFPESISAFVMNHCDGLNDEACTRMVEELKSNDKTKDFVASMGKGVYTVSFPNLTQVPELLVEPCKQIIQEDVSKLHQLIEQSSDTVDVLKTDKPSCSII